MKRKRLLVSVGVCLILMLATLPFMAACAAPPTPTTPTPTTPTPTPTPTPTTPAPTTIERVRIALTSIGNEALDPAYSHASCKLYLEYMYDFLVGAAPEGGGFSKETGIANDWTLSPDGKVWTFKLRQGVKFHNGYDLTASDVKFTLIRNASETSTLTYSALLAETIDHINVVNPYELEIHCTRPSAGLIKTLSRLGGPEGMIVSERYIEEQGEEYVRLHPIGSGPYKFVEHEMGDHLIMEAVENHWRAGRPRVKILEFKIVPEASTRAAMLERGEAQIVSVGITTANRLREAGYDVILSEDAQCICAQFNSSWEPDSPFKDIKFRQALTLAIDNDAILERILLGMGYRIPVYPWFTWGLGLIEDLPLRPYDPEKAKQLLSESTYSQLGSPAIKLNSYPRPGLPEVLEIGEAVASYWQEIGVNVEIVLTEYGAYREKWIKHLVEPNSAAIHTNGNRTLTTTLMTAMHDEDSKFPVHETDPVIDEALEAAGNALTEEEEDEALKRAFRQKYEMYYVVALAMVHEPWCATKDITGMGWTIPPGVMNNIGLETLYAEK